MTIKLTINNVKGGVGKTTTATNLSIGLARMDKKVLFVDTDPQGNGTKHLYLDVMPKLTIKDLFEGVEPKEIITPSIENNLDIIPSCLSFATIELDIMSKFARESILRKALSKIESNYDMIIIDTQPSVGIIPVNALCAADQVLIPVYEAYSLDALMQMSYLINEIRKEINPDLEVLGILLTMYDPRTLLAKEIKAKLQDKFGALLFETTIPRNVKLAECPSHKKSIYEYAPESTGALAYKQLTEEILKIWGLK
jgi:chromosome partitioning protein